MSQLAILKAATKDVSRTVRISSGEIEQHPVAAHDLSLLMIENEDFAEIFENVGAVLDDPKEFVRMLREDQVMRALFARVIALSMRETSSEALETILALGMYDFQILGRNALELSAPRGVVDFFLEVGANIRILVDPAVLERASDKPVSTPSSSSSPSPSSKAAAIRKRRR